MKNKLFLFVTTVLAMSGAAQAQTLSLQGARQTFGEEFTTLPAWRKGETPYYEKSQPLGEAPFQWSSGYVWNHPPAGVKRDWRTAAKIFPAWTSNKTADADPNGDMIAKIGRTQGPFDISKTGELLIKARPMPAYIGKTVGVQDAPAAYISGTITSFPYAQKYGVFTIRARVPAGKGTWPAFWLLRADHEWPPELDVMEVLGGDTKTLYTTLHYKDAKGGHAQTAKAIKTGIDLSAGFHEYTVDWGPKEIRWYFDGQQVFATPTPASLNQPCYMIANLAIGKKSSWGGAPDAKTKFPAEYRIDYIRAFQRPEYEALQ